MNEGDPTSDHIVLGANLAEMSRLPEWIAALAVSYSIAEDRRFAIHLCLEEAVSNIIRHGYADGAAGREAVPTVTIACTQNAARELVFTIDDTAAPFNPLTAPEPPLLDADGEIALGGRGLRLLRSFADSLEYERAATGNRLRIGFRKSDSESL